MSEFRINGMDSLATSAANEAAQKEALKPAQSAIKENVDGNGEFRSFEYSFAFGKDNCKIYVSNDPGLRHDQHRTPMIVVSKNTADGKYIDSTNFIIAEKWYEKSEVSADQFKDICKKIITKIEADMKALIETEGTDGKEAFNEVAKIVGQFRKKD